MNSVQVGTPPITFTPHVGANGPDGHVWAYVSIPDGVVVGGGALVEWRGAGNLLTGTWPDERGGWNATCKDHGTPSPATLRVWCVSALVSKDDVYVARAANADHTGVVGAHARLPGEYTLIGGGARAYLHEDDPGCLLIASFPSAKGQGWDAYATDHGTQSPVVVEAYAIGIHTKLLTDHKLRVERHTGQSSAAKPHPDYTVRLTSVIGKKRGIVTCGGVRPTDTQHSLLTESYPDDDEITDARGWIGASKDHGVPAPTRLEVTGLVVVEV